jgi:hypothetical protein
MKTILSIKPHSCVDLITNSSSELFIWDVNQTLQAIKETILQLVQDVNSSGEESISESEIYRHIFQEPVVCLFNFDFTKYPRQSEYHSVHDYNTYTSHPVHISCAKQDKAFQATTPRPNSDNTKEMNKWYKAYHKIWKPWNDIREEENMALYRWIFNLNNLPWTHVPGNRDNCPEFWAIADQFSSAISYRYVMEKGAVTLMSAGDNSIPWALMDKIESALPCKRFHLG